MTAVVLLEASVVSGSQDESVRQWDLSSGECLKTLWGHHKGITSLGATTDFMHVFSGADDFTVRVWAVEKGALRDECVQVFENHTEEVTCVCVTSGGERIVSGGRDARLCICDAVAVDEVAAEEEGDIPFIAIADEERTIATLANLVTAQRMNISGGLSQ